MLKKEVDNTLDVLLEEYPESQRFLKAADYVSPNHLVGYLHSDPNWSYDGDGDSPVDHFALTESVFMHNQMAYTLIACMAQEGCFDRVKPLSLDVINAKKFNGFLLTSYQANFRQSFPSSERFSFQFNVDKSRVRRAPSGLLLFTNNSFEFAGGKAYGNSKIVVRLDEDEVVPR